MSTPTQKLKSCLIRAWCVLWNKLRSKASAELALKTITIPKTKTESTQTKSTKDCQVSFFSKLNLNAQVGYPLVADG